jgi:hypothetical protein
VEQLNLPVTDIDAFLYDFKLLPTSDINVLRDNEIIQVVPQTTWAQLQVSPFPTSYMRSSQ